MLGLVLGLVSSAFRVRVSVRVRVRFREHLVSGLGLV